MPTAAIPTAPQRKRVCTRAHPAAIRMQALALLSTGRTRGYVANALGLSSHTVSAWQNRYGTTKIARNLKQSDQLTVERTVARALADDGKATREKLAATVKRSAETLADAKLATVSEVAEVAPVVRSLVSSAEILHQWDRDGQDGVLALGSYLETVDEVGEAVETLHPETPVAGKNAGPRNAIHRSPNRLCCQRPPQRQRLPFLCRAGLCL